MTTRRGFLTTTALAAQAFVTPRRPASFILPAALRRGGGPERRTFLGEPDVKALTYRALEAATAAGASYAEVRFTVTRERTFRVDAQPVERRVVAVGVRALANGAWGFAADSELTPDMMAWLGTTAARLGKGSAWPGVPPVELAARPVIASGHWQMPVQRDPMSVPDTEYEEVLGALRGAAARLQAPLIYQLTFGSQERTYASTDGTFVTQTVYQTFKAGADGNPSLTVMAPVVDPNDRKKKVKYFNPYVPPEISPNGLGFEVFTVQKLVERIPEWVEQAQRSTTAQPLNSPGRYEVVLDGYTMGALVSTLGAALEADRVLGYQANNVGSSYLAPPDKVLGTTPFPSAMTVTADPTMVGGAATFKWDDEGVEAQTFPLIQAGRLVDYATGRETAVEASAWYQRQGQPVCSRGCAGAESALVAPLVQTPNLTLTPGAADTTFEALCAGITKGYAFMGGNVRPDQQQRSVIGSGTMVYEIKQGRLGPVVSDARFLARLPELWKNLVTLGGERTVVAQGFTVAKGQPEQALAHTVRAPAARFTNVSIVGAAR
jgi:TldD protein